MKLYLFTAWNSSK